MLHYGQPTNLHFRMTHENNDGERVRLGRVVADGGSLRQYSVRRVAKGYNQLSRLVGGSDETAFRQLANV